LRVRGAEKNGKWVIQKRSGSVNAWAKIKRSRSVDRKARRKNYQSKPKGKISK